MKSLAAAVLFVAFLALLGCGEEANLKTTFDVSGMHCDGCSSAITEALSNVDGVDSATADHETGIVEAVHWVSTVSAEELEITIEKLGYTVAGFSSAGVE